MTARAEFSSGRFATVELLRATALSPEQIAHELNMEPATFLRELDEWSRGIGLPYGITVDLTSGTIDAPFVATSRAPGR